MKKDIEKFIRSHIIKSIKDNVIQKNGFILFQPINDIIAGYCFEQSSSGGRDLYIWGFVQPLYIKDDIIHLTFGKRMTIGSSKSELFNLDILMSNQFELDKLLDKMNENVTSLKKLSIPYEFYSFYKNVNQDMLRFRQAVIYTSLWLSSPDSKEKLSKCIAYIRKEKDIAIGWINDILNEMIQLQQENNHKKLLEEWKRATLENLKLK